MVSLIEFTNNHSGVIVFSFEKTFPKTEHFLALQFINLSNSICFKSIKHTFIKHNNDSETEASKVGLADIQYEIKFLQVFSVFFCIVYCSRIFNLYGLS